MAKKNIKGTAEESVVNVDEALTRTEQFFEDNQRVITAVIVAVFIVVGGFFLYKSLYQKPREKEAQSQMFMAERYFELDSFNLALNGDGNYLGFADIVDEFGFTKSGNLSAYYAGISSLYLGDYDKAIEYLKKFSANDKTMPSLKSGAIGDAYLEKQQPQQALSYYLDAVGDDPNQFTTPVFMMKAAGVHEQLNEYSQALKLYKAIKADYPQSEEARNVDKYIARAELKGGK